MDQVRELFINVKLGVFGTYVENNNRFPKIIQELNIKALRYFKNVQTKNILILKIGKYFMNYTKKKLFHITY